MAIRVYDVNQFSSKTGEYGFHPVIYNQQNEKRLGRMVLRGPQRKSNDGENTSNFFETHTIFRDSYRCNFDENCYRDPTVIFKNFGKGIYFNYDTKIDLEKNRDKLLIYSGYYDKNGRRYYRFLIPQKNGKKEIIDFYYKKIDSFTYCYNYEGDFF